MKLIPSDFIIVDAYSMYIKLYTTDLLEDMQLYGGQLDFCVFIEQYDTIQE